MFTPSHTSNRVKFIILKQKMIHAHYYEKRVCVKPGQTPETLVREVNLDGKKTHKRVRVYRGNKLMSTVEKPLSAAEKKNIQAHMFTPNLFTLLNRRTVTNMNRTRKQSKHSKHSKHSKK